jgi:hypothetical protein
MGVAFIMCKKEGTNRKMNGLCILAYPVGVNIYVIVLAI